MALQEHTSRANSAHQSLLRVFCRFSLMRVTPGSPCIAPQKVGHPGGEGLRGRVREGQHVRGGNEHGQLRLH